MLDISIDDVILQLQIVLGVRELMNTDKMRQVESVAAERANEGQQKRPWIKPVDGIPAPYSYWQSDV